jgi:hypothetical protein
MHKQLELQAQVRIRLNLFHMKKRINWFQVMAIYRVKIKFVPDVEITGSDLG